MEKPSLIRLAPLAASVLLHMGLVGAMTLAAGDASVSPRIVIVELAALEPLPEAPAPRQTLPPDPRPLRLPKPLWKPPARPEERVAPAPADPVKPEPLPAPQQPPAPAAPAATPTPPEAEPSTPVAPAPSEPAPSAAPSPPARTEGRVASSMAPATQPESGPAAATWPSAPGPLGVAEMPPQARGPERDVASLPGDTSLQVARPRGGYQVRPAYPATARRLGVQGTTILRIYIAADGRVTEIVVEQSAGHGDLDAAASDSVRRWRFEPARRGTEAIGMWVRLPVEFRLR